MTRLRLLVADGHELVRRGVRELFAGSNTVDVVGDAHDRESALAAAERLRPDVVVMDIVLPGGSGLRFVEELKSISPDIRLVAFTARDEQGFIRSALDAGIAAYVLKQSAATVLRDAVEAIHTGSIYLDASLVASSPLRGASSPSTPLSEREREVIGAVAFGYSNKEIACQLNLSVKTVETYRYRAGEKLGLHNRADFVRYALHRGWMLADWRPQDSVATMHQQDNL